MTKFRNLGVGIAIDDFGTGYSSLSCLQRLPIDTLKIDQSFVRDLTAPADTLALVQSIISLARSLGMRTTAEGIETQSQLDVLQGTDCNFVQGFFFARPLTADQVSPLLHGGPGLARFIAAVPPPKEDTRSRQHRRPPAISRPQPAIQRNAGNMSVV